MKDITPSRAGQAILALLLLLGILGKAALKPILSSPPRVVEQVVSFTIPSQTAVPAREDRPTAAALARITPSPTLAPPPTAAPSATAEPLPSPVPTRTATPTPSPTATPSPAPTHTATPTPSPTATPSPTPTRTATVTATPLPSPTATHTVTPMPSSTATPTATPKPSPTVTPTVTPSFTATLLPSPTASATPSPSPTATATPSPTAVPSATPTLAPVSTATPPPTAAASPAPAVALAPARTPPPAAAVAALSLPDLPSPTRRFRPVPLPRITSSPVHIPSWTEWPASPPRPTVFPLPASSPAPGLSRSTPALPASVTPAAPAPGFQAERFLHVDQDKQTMYVYEKGVQVRTIPVSTGAPTTNTFTPPWQGVVGAHWGSGAFRVDNLLADDIWYLFPGPEGSILIHSVPYNLVGETKVYNQLNALGVKPVSHGCVRISPEDAEWLKAWNPVGVAIEITPWSGKIAPGEK